MKNCTSIRFQVSGVRCQEVETRWPPVNVKSEPQNIEYRTAECRRVESLRSAFFKIDRIHYFDIRHSLFDIRYSLLKSFFHRPDRPLFSPAAVLNADT
ncbi:hypothetical protein D1AOALGA4SA_8272 [Olavius algarvensis Delta 1 endosymbiont]|nr:hypothetical protein D1AOALGA4SA_8272 [Olavius algarvensis Delta 1 endosymbiont]